MAFSSQSNRVHTKTNARRLALQLLYQSELLGVPASEILKEQRYIIEEGIVSSYAEKLILGTQEHTQELDSILEKTSQNWLVERMPIVDRVLLRLAVYEMKYVDEAPISVTINEVVELAKSFASDDDSHRFVNGMLGRIALEMGASDQDLSLIDAMADLSQAHEEAEREELACAVKESLKSYEFQQSKEATEPSSEESQEKSPNA